MEQFRQRAGGGESRQNLTRQITPEQQAQKVRQANRIPKAKDVKIRRNRFLDF